MISDAHVLVECNGCGDAIEIRLIATDHGYYKGDISFELAAQGWVTVDDDTHFCSSDCKEAGE